MKYLGAAVHTHMGLTHPKLSRMSSAGCRYQDSGPKERDPQAKNLGLGLTSLEIWHVANWSMRDSPAPLRKVQLQS